MSTTAQGTAYNSGTGIEAKIRSDLSPACIDETSKIIIPASTITSILGITASKIVTGNTICGVAGTAKTADSKKMPVFYIKMSTTVTMSAWSWAAYTLTSADGVEVEDGCVLSDGGSLIVIVKSFNDTSSGFTALIVNPTSKSVTIPSNVLYCTELD